MESGNRPITAAWFQKVKTTQVFNEMIFSFSNPPELPIAKSDLMSQPPPVSNSVMVVGGEDLPKVSTQALKQQYEKSIEEAAPSKQIKVITSIYPHRGYYGFFMMCVP